MKNKWFYIKVLGVIIGGAMVFWILAVCAFEFFNFGIIDAQGIVLVLIGILATFVVVSNYAQVLTIKQDFENKITEIEQNCKKQIETNTIDIEKRLKNKLILSNRIDAFMPKFNAYRKLINEVFTNVDFWKNKDVINQYNFLSLYDAYKFISDGYRKDVTSESIHRIPKVSEIEQYKTNANWIWYTNTSKRYINSQLHLNSFTNLDEFAKRNIQECLEDFNGQYSTQYSIKEFSIDLIAEISGNVEVEVLAPLVDFITQYNFDK